jgi:putative ABC transport system permease protein
MAEESAFYMAGTSLLVSLIALVSLSLRWSQAKPISGGGIRGLAKLSLRNATHRPARSLVCVALVASAAFIIISVEAFRQDPGTISTDRSSGTGGYAYAAETTLPVVQNPNSPEGRESLGIPDPEFPDLAKVKFAPFRLRPGDDTSCLNLYAPQEPRIIGATHDFLSEGRFRFVSAAAAVNSGSNPWLQLEEPVGGGAVPAIGDANTITYVLHSAVGKEIEIHAADGSTVRLRIVAALSDSLLQSELVVSEQDFLRLFPAIEGYRFFLLDIPQEKSGPAMGILKDRLSDFGFTAQSSRERIASYHRVENTYLSTFQSLGMLGLLLGTAGLATVLLRNVLERRKELALMRAFGFEMRRLQIIVFLEHAWLIVMGLASGTLSALISIIPALISRGMPFPVTVSVAALGAVLLAGLLSAYIASLLALRSPLLGALKSE